MKLPQVPCPCQTMRALTRENILTKYCNYRELPRFLDKIIVDNMTTYLNPTWIASYREPQIIK